MMEKHWLDVWKLDQGDHWGVGFGLVDWSLKAARVFYL